VKVVTSEPLHAVVLPMKGSYTQHPEAFQRLGTMLSTRGVAIPESIFARYFSDPSVGEESLAWEVGCAVPADFKAEAPFEIRDIAATLTASKQHTRPMEELVTAWPEFIQWVMSNGYQPAGPAMQVFTGFMTGSPQVELRMPVQK
jgi:effector-binding domain-containing protein